MFNVGLLTGSINKAKIVGQKSTKYLINQHAEYKPESRFVLNCVKILVTID